MTVTEALKVLQQASKAHGRFEAFFACGFTPLHLQLFLGAHLQKQLVSRRVQTATGVYGNLATSLERLSETQSDAVACTIEWADLDPRLGYREGGSWGISAIPDILTASRQMLGRIRGAIQRIPAGIRVAISTPTLPLPPLFHTPGWQADEAELFLDQAISDFAASVIERRGTAIVNARRLNEISPSAARLDLKSDLATGLPYTTAHADHLAAALARLLVPPVPKKAVITDLDDTLWHGLVGEVGPDGVTWDVGSHQQLHGLYQKLLSSLADAGVLLAIASKNDSAVVAQALARPDLLVGPDRIFPVEVHWNAKSGSVARILEAWNIGADSVIFVDDSPLELAEVAAAFPEVTCLRFPKNDPSAGLAVLRQLRDFCGKEAVSPDDSLRLDSIRQGAEFRRQSASGPSPETFFAEMHASITLEPASDDSRALELVNKTNQFNINGVRFTASDWQRRAAEPGAFTRVFSYQDKFGPLGKIAAMQGRLESGVAAITTWVMSCRAFARRIEYQCLKSLFENDGAREIVIALTPTPKNQPAQDFLNALCGPPVNGAFRLTPAQFAEKCPALYHHVLEVEPVTHHG